MSTDNPEQPTSTPPPQPIPPRVRSKRRSSPWSPEDDAILEAGYHHRRAPSAIARELGRTLAAVQVRACTFGLTGRKRPRRPPSPRPQDCKQRDAWRDLTLLLSVGQRWSSYSKSVQDLFLERIGAVRR